MNNVDVLVKNPLLSTIPNDGVAKISEPKTDQEWNVLRFELANFVCEGEYQRGLEKILGTYLNHLDQPTQPAVWVSGFYGSGKSHLVRVLEYLWRDVPFPDGQTARDLTTLPLEIKDHLVQLSTRGKQAGGLWAAAGTLGSSAGESARLAVLGIAFQSQGLPQNYAQGRFVLWLRQNGLEAALGAKLLEVGKTLENELQHLYVSQHLAKGLLEVVPDFASDVKQARELIKAQFPNLQDITEADFLETFTAILTLNSVDRSRIPCALLVLDELQQYIGDSNERNERVHRVIELCTSQFGSKLLVVATGQSAMQATPQLAKLQGRFTVRVSLSDTDVEKVIREVVLRKQPAKIGALQAVLDQTSGEIDRHLAGTKIAPTTADKAVLVADYPLLPARRRLWERVLRAVDRAGASGQLRTQLRVVFDAICGVAEMPLGTVVAADTIYDQQSQDWIQSGVLNREKDELIRGERDGTPDGKLRSRLCALVFLISQLPTETNADIGVRATAEVLADLLVEDLRAGSSSLRSRIPELLAGMVESGKLLLIDGEYRLQTREGGEWDGTLRAVKGKILDDEGRLANERAALLKARITAQLAGISLVHGEGKEPRKLELHFGSEAPKIETNIPVWVRDGWNISDKDAKTEAQNVGPDSPLIIVFVPRQRAEELKRVMADSMASHEVLTVRPIPTTREGIEAKDAMASRERRFKSEVEAIIQDVVDKATVLQGGGSEVIEANLKASVTSAANNSLARMYPDFAQADHAAWGKVVDRARDGNGDALNLVGHAGDPNQHPVAKRIVGFIAGGGKKGSEIRAHFGAMPFGWSKDAIDGALFALVAGGFVKASQNGQPVTVKQIERNKLSGFEFRSEIAVISASQRLEVRKLLGIVGIAFKPNDEPLAAMQLVTHLLEVAAQAGGDAPLPAKPHAPHLEELKSLSGNELLLKVWESRARLEEEFQRWSAAKATIQVRKPRWDNLVRLVRHARNLPDADAHAQRLAAIESNRGLLEEPDPVPHALGEVASDLRKAVTEAHTGFEQSFDAGIAKLEANTAWQALAETERQNILNVNEVRRPNKPELGTESELLVTLDKSSLKDWADRRDALPARFDRALSEAMKRLEPKAVQYHVPSANLKTEADVKTYLEKLEKELLEHIHAGNPVIL